MAIKIIDKEDENFESNECIIENENDILSDLPRSSSLVSFYEVTDILSQKLETEDKIYLVFEYFEGEELYQIVRRKKRLAEKDACYCFYIIIRTMKELKTAGIVHRDIKAENILINESQNQVKLIDFGFSRKYKPGKLMKTAMGSPHYSAPEILAKEQYDPVCADIWSAGVVLFFMLCGRNSSD